MNLFLKIDVDLACVAKLSPAMITELRSSRLYQASTSVYQELQQSKVSTQAPEGTVSLVAQSASDKVYHVTACAADEHEIDLASEAVRSVNRSLPHPHLRSP